MSRLTGNILVIEDEFLIALELVDALEDRGAAIVGPVSGVKEAIEHIARVPELHGAVLDLNLRGEIGIPVADELMAKGIPFIFTSGYAAADIPEAFRHVPLLGKPTDVDAIVEALMSQMR